eukprot:6479525-Amphidinium_carterae.2
MIICEVHRLTLAEASLPDAACLSERRLSHSPQPRLHDLTQNTELHDVTFIRPKRSHLPKPVVCDVGFALAQTLILRNQSLTLTEAKLPFCCQSLNLGFDRTSCLSFVQFFGNASSDLGTPHASFQQQHLRRSSSSSCQQPGVMSFLRFRHCC